MKELVLISKYAGMREDLVQAGGGNSSVKIDERTMAIKSSGIQLADVTETTGFSIVDYQMIFLYMQELLNKEPRYTEKEILEKALLNGPRPSIEIFLHAITGRVTLHVHSTAASVLVARVGGMEYLKQMFPDALFVGYATPGVKLAALYYQAYLKQAKKEKQIFKVIFLQNHGVIISGNTAEEVIQLTDEVNKKIESVIGLDNSSYRIAFELSEKFRSVCEDDEKIVVRIESKKVLDTYKTFGYHLWDYQVCPDCVVFCGKKSFQYCPASFLSDYHSYVSDYGIPIIIQYKNELFIRAISIKKAREIESVLAYSAQIALYNRKYEKVLLSEEEQNFLLNWDAEKYRQNIK